MQTISDNIDALFVSFDEGAGIAKKERSDTTEGGYSLHC
jgi:hypothetical protein